MALPTFPDYPPLLESDQESTEIRTDLAQFGDGYRQETEAGINARQSIGSWSWLLERDDIQTIETFLETNGVSGFEFTPPHLGSARNYKCTKWKRTWFNGDADKIVAQFEQIFVP